MPKKTQTMRRLYLPAFAILAAAFALVWMRADRSPAGRAHAAASPGGRGIAKDGLAAALRVQGEHVLRQRYSLEYSHRVAIDGQDLAPTWVNATWTTEPAGGDRIHVTLSDVELGGVEVLPEPAAMATHFQIAHQNGRLLGLGFPLATPMTARGLITTLACALWYTPDPDASERWSVEEDDRTGRYRARYQWQADGTLLRHREGFLAMRTPQGLDPRRARGLSSDGETRFSFDDSGLHQVVVNERVTLRMGEGMPTMTVTIEARLRRLQSRQVAARSIAALPLEPIRAHGQAGEPSEREVAMQQLGGATVADLLAEVQAVKELAARSKEEEAWRARTLDRLTALLRADPASTEAVARALANAAGDDPRRVAVVAGALGDAATPEATAALADLLSSSDVPGSAKMNVAVALALTQAPSAESAGALTGMLDDPEVGPSAALALGAQAGKLSETQPEAATSAVELLLERYARSSDLNERATLLGALANSGDPRALPVMREAILGPDTRMAELGTYGLRFIPGAEADALLLQQLTTETSREIKVQAIRAVGHRPAADWHQRLLELGARHPSESAIRETIAGVLASWGVESA